MVALMSAPSSTSPDLRTKLLDILLERSVRRGEFTLASGAKSDLYVNCKLTALDPAAALLIGAVGWELLQQTAEETDTRIDAVGGLTMGADPIALSIGIAAQLEDPGTRLQTFTVRKAAKEHGTKQKLIEGNFAAGKHGGRHRRRGDDGRLHAASLRRRGSRRRQGGVRHRAGGPPGRRPGKHRGAGL